MKTEILKIKGDWEEVVNDCRSTVGKSELGREPSNAFKRSILISEHSPIRDIQIKWRWANIKSWVATHWVRHKWECFVRTQRTDRTGVNRDSLPQDAPVDFVGDANVQALIDTMRKRLCCQASSETRQYAEDLKSAVWDKERAISNVLVPNCVYRCGCPELNPCGYWDRLVKETKGAILTSDIQQRYDLYNEIFWERGTDENT